MVYTSTTWNKLGPLSFFLNPFKKLNRDLPSMVKSNMDIRNKYLILTIFFVKENSRKIASKIKSLKIKFCWREIYVYPEYYEAL